MENDLIRASLRRLLHHLEPALENCRVLGVLDLRAGFCR